MTQFDHLFLSPDPTPLLFVLYRREHCHVINAWLDSYALKGMLNTLAAVHRFTFRHFAPQGLRHALVAGGWELCVIHRSNGYPCIVYPPSTSPGSPCVKMEHHPPQRARCPLAVGAAHWPLGPYALSDIAHRRGGKRLPPGGGGGSSCPGEGCLFQALALPRPPVLRACGRDPLPLFLGRRGPP